MDRASLFRSHSHAWWIPGAMDSNPRAEARDREIDDAYDRLRALGLDPDGYFRPGEY
jgi:hypothetical protein